LIEEEEVINTNYDVTVEEKTREKEYNVALL
jgi:hypothetical protein